jgi:3-keto-5-aminohexanoate cleavage enzyme
VSSGLADRVTRVLVEPGEDQADRDDAIPMVDAIHAILDRAGVTAPRLQHGDGELTWILIEDAVRRGLDTRVGFEDTLHLPDGSRASSNADLVTAARSLGAGTTGPR